jgi:hypothetical protein
MMHSVVKLYTLSTSSPPDMSLSVAPDLEIDSNLWSELKAIHHALSRALSLPPTKLRELDRDRLRDLHAILLRSLSQELGTPSERKAAFRSGAISEPSFVPEISIKSALMQNETFAEWQATEDFEFKVTILVEALAEFSESSRAADPSLEVPRDELALLRSTLSPLLQMTRTPVHD